MKNILVKSVAELIDAIGAKGAQSITLEKGVYRLESPLVIDGIDKGLVIEGAGAIMSGDRIVTNSWKRVKGDIWAVNIDMGLDIQSIFVNGEPYIMARYPNYAEGEILNGYSSDCISKIRVMGWSNPSTGYVRALHNHEWGGNSYKILGRTETGDLKFDWIGDNNRGAEHHKNFVMVEGIFEELDSPKEWFYDKENGVIYIMAEKGVSLENCLVEYTVNSDLIKIINSQKVEIKNLNFMRTNRTMFNSKYEKITRSDWAIARRGAVLLENTRNIKITNCHFEHIGGNCLFMSGKNENNMVEDCEFTNCGASGVVIFGDQSACRDLSTWENHKTTISDEEVGAQNDKYPKKISVLNCYFYNLGIYEKQSAPVSISVAEDVTVRGCTIHHMPRAGLNVCDGTFGGHIFEDNDIFDTVRESGDHGPFNSWGRDRYWSLSGFDTVGKKGDIKGKYAKLDAHKTISINHNRIVGTRGFGIDLDDGSTNYKITNNLCYGVGIKLREGFCRHVENNILIGAPLDLHCTFCGNDDIIKNNVVVAKKPLNVVFLNNGFTTKLIKNLFVNASRTTLKQAIFKHSKDNECVSMGAEQIDELNFDSAFHTKFSMNFGLEGKPKPIIHANSHEENVVKLHRYGLTMTNVTESVKTVAGAPDYDGVFVLKARFGKMKRVGIKQGDLIFKINGVKINNEIDIKNYKGKLINIEIYRSQTKTSINKR